MPQDFMETMRKQVSVLLESMKLGANGGAGGQQLCNFQAGGPEATPNPAERKRMRLGLLPVGTNKDVNMENGLTPITIPVATMETLGSSIPPEES